MNNNLLADIFEKHLFEFETADENPRFFAARVIADYLNQLELQGRYVANGPCCDDVYLELEDEILTMLKKKTYGHYNLKEYRILWKRRQKSHL